MGSFTATVISDLAAFIADKELYSAIINDIKAAKIIPEYWQILDNPSIFDIEGTDIITYPRIEYSDTLTSFSELNFADHIRHEPRSFKIVESIGAQGLMIMMLLMRDRYFPTIWPLIA